MPEIKPDKKRKIIMGAGIFYALLILALVILLIMQLAPKKHQAVLPTILPVTYATPTILPPTVTLVPTTDPNRFDGDWIFVKFDGKEKTGALKGNDIGWFKSVVTGEVIHAVCSSPRSPAPNPGDVFFWDPTTNILVPRIGDVPKGTVQRFWYPSR